MSAVELVEQLRRANARLREVVAAKDAEIEALRAVMDAQIGELSALVKAQGLRIAELERRLGSSSDDSGTPTSKDSTEARARQKSERKGSSVNYLVERFQCGGVGRWFGCDR
jgi:hypothetical protein